MAQLAQRRLSCRRRINKLSSPTAKIPSEILTEIFQIACRPVDNGRGARQAVTPLLIGSICRQWRDVTWSSPLLWSTIFMHVSRKTHGTQIQLLGDWLLNAKSAPLSIKLIEENEHESVLSAFEAIMRILVTRSDYWLTFDSFLPLRCHYIFININFPMLTSVSLRSSVSAVTIPQMSLTAPRLVDVTLDCYLLASSLWEQVRIPLVLPWEQVRRIRRVQSLAITECLEVLQQSPNLQECFFGGVYSSRDWLIPESIMLHDQLKDLRVRLINSWDTSLFDCITLPSLSNLHIRYLRKERLLLSSITSLVLRSACNLERFSIEFRFDCADLILCLEAIPSLTYLHLEMTDHSLVLEGLGLTRHLVASLDPLSNSSRLLLPNLEYFEFKGLVLCDCRTIVDMLVHRWYLSGDSGTSQSIGVSKLKVAEILSISPYHVQVTADVREELRNLMEEGMSIRIETIF
jgi:F-box-like